MSALFLYRARLRYSVSIHGISQELPGKIQAQHLPQHTPVFVSFYLLDTKGTETRCIGTRTAKILESLYCVHCFHNCVGRLPLGITD